MATELTKILDLEIRPGNSDDLGYVIDSWGRSLRAEYPDSRTTDFVNQLKKGIAKRLDDGAQILVAYPKDEPGLILGWLCMSPKLVVHFVYVRNAYRRCGIARRILEQADICPQVVTDTMTDYGRQVRAANPESIKYLPNV